MHLALERNTQQGSHVAGMKAFGIDALPGKPSPQFQETGKRGYIFQAIESDIVVQHPFVMAERPGHLVTDKGNKAAIGGFEIHAIVGQARIGDAGEVLEIIRQHRIYAGPHQAVETGGDGETLPVQAHRADLHHFLELARRQPMPGHGIGPGCEFQIENHQSLYHAKARITASGPD